MQSMQQALYPTAVRLVRILFVLAALVSFGAHVYQYKWGHQSDLDAKLVGFSELKVLDQELSFLVYEAEEEQDGSHLVACTAIQRNAESHPVLANKFQFDGDSREGITISILPAAAYR